MSLRDLLPPQNIKPPDDIVGYVGQQLLTPELIVVSPNILEMLLLARIIIENLLRVLVTNQFILLRRQYHHWRVHFRDTLVQVEFVELEISLLFDGALHKHQSG